MARPREFDEIAVLEAATARLSGRYSPMPRSATVKFFGLQQNAFCSESGGRMSVNGRPKQALQLHVHGAMGFRRCRAACDRLYTLLLGPDGSSAGARPCDLASLSHAVEHDPNPHLDYQSRERGRRYAADFPAALFPSWTRATRKSQAALTIANGYREEGPHQPVG
jgi:hypothetical protein